MKSFRPPSIKQRMAANRQVVDRGPSAGRDAADDSMLSLEVPRSMRQGPRRQMSRVMRRSYSR